MKHFKRIIVIAFLALCLCGCSASFGLYAEIPDYRGVIGGISMLPPNIPDTPVPPEPPIEPEVPPEPDEPPEVPKKPSIDGFTLITADGVDEFALFGESKYTPITADGSKKLMDKGGNISDKPDDLSELSYDKYVFIENGRYGVKSAQGTVLIPASYSAVDMIGNTVLALNSDYIHIYNASMTDSFGNTLLISETARSRFSSVALYSDSLVVADGVLCSLGMRRVTYGGYVAVAVNGDFAVIKDDEENLGYYHIPSASVTVRPRYYSASFYLNGYATVSETFGGTNIVIDESGFEVACFENVTYGFYDGYMFVADGFSRLRLYDSHFEDTEITFDEVLHRRVYNGFVVDTAVNRLYDIAERKYVGDSYSEIIPFGKGFICSGADGSVLLDGKLETIAMFDEIIADNNALWIQQNGKYYYFLPQNEK